MLDKYDREELKRYLSQCVTLSQLMSKHPITHGMLKNGPKHLWKQGNTILYDRDEFMAWYETRKYKPWTKLEIRLLIILRNKGMNWSTIAYKLERSTESCRSKWKDLNRRGFSTSEQEDQAS